MVSGPVRLGRWGWMQLTSPYAVLLRVGLHKVVDHLPGGHAGRHLPPTSTHQRMGLWASMQAACSNPRAGHRFPHSPAEQDTLRMLLGPRSHDALPVCTLVCSLTHPCNLHGFTYMRSGHHACA